jgi:aspartokinase-like uncharacterized kinase
LYKVGGSLFTLPDLARRITDSLKRWPDSRPLLVAGGGEAANIVRRWDARYHLGPERAHWLALWSMKLNEALLRDLLVTTRIVSNRRAADVAWESGELPIICAHDFLRAEPVENSENLQNIPAAGCDDLPHTWDVTSDSIAAWIACRWPADRLVLLKSCSLPSEDNGRSSTAGNLVDACFQRFASQLPEIVWVNLRAEQPSIEPWRAPMLS